MEMDQRQVEEMFLTGAQSLFAVAILANLSFSLMAAIVIFALFATQLLVPDPALVLVAGKKDTRDGVFGLFSRGAATEALEKR